MLASMGGFDPEPATEVMQSQDSSAVSIYQKVFDLFAHVPDGTDVDADQFQTVLDTSTAEGLKARGIVHVTNVSGHFTVTLDHRREVDLKKAKLQLDSTLSFTLSRQTDSTAQAEVLAFSEIKGAKVKVSWLLGWMDLLYFDLSPRGTGNTLIFAKVHVFGRDIGHKVLINPEGKSLPYKEPSSH